MLFADKKIKNIDGLLKVDISNALVVFPNYYDETDNESSIIVINNDYDYISHIHIHTDREIKNGHWYILNICDVLNAKIANNELLDAYNVCRNRKDISVLKEYIKNINDYEISHIILDIWYNIAFCNQYSDTSNSSLDNIKVSYIKEIYNSSDLIEKDELYLGKYISYYNMICDISSSTPLPVMNDYDALTYSIIKKNLTSDEVDEIINVKLGLCDDVQKYAITKYISNKYCDFKLNISEPHRTIAKNSINRKIIRKMIHYTDKP